MSVLDRKDGLLVVRRINWFSAPPTGQPVAERTAAVAKSHEEILRTYRGIEGEPWPILEDMTGIHLEEGLASCAQYSIVFTYYETVAKIYPCDLIHCELTPKSVSLPRDLPPGFIFCGYDYGCYLSETNYFSSLFNEVIYGKYEVLRDYAKFLNEHLLLPSLDLVSRLDTSRRTLAEEGADLETEDGEIFAPIAVHAPVKTR